MKKLLVIFISVFIPVASWVGYGVWKLPEGLKAVAITALHEKVADDIIMMHNDSIITDMDIFPLGWTIIVKYKNCDYFIKGRYKIFFGLIVMPPPFQEIAVSELFSDCTISDERDL